MSLGKPTILFTDVFYPMTESSWVSISEASYNTQVRVNNGFVAGESPATNKMSVTRANVLFQNILLIDLIVEDPI